MPLPYPTAQPVRAHPQLSRAQIRSLVAYIGSLGGPPIPRVSTNGASVVTGRELYAANCASCHQITGSGGVVPGANVPALQSATPRQIAEAIRLGPYLMPRFSRGELSDRQVADIATYVVSSAAQTIRGWAIGHLGPVPEGMVAWGIGVVALLVIARLIGERISRMSHRRAELITAGLLGAAALCALGFVVVYVVNTSTQLLGLAFGAALLLIAAALILAGRYVVTQEAETEERPQLESPEAQAEVEQEVETGGADVTRKRLLTTAGSGRGGSPGPGRVGATGLARPADRERLGETPWRAGTRLVDERGRPIAAAAVVPGSFLTAYPDGADPREVGSPVIVVGLHPRQLRLPWAGAAGPQGASSPTPRSAPTPAAPWACCAPHSTRRTRRRPGMVCPCHYSTFDPATGGTVVFGPAGRPLPQLPIRTDTDGTLRATGHMSGPVGPAWWSYDS